MAEYYAVLSKAVAGLESNGADTRRAVYDKARNALIGQLKAIEPPLPTAEISRQRLELEEAIRRVEREAGAAPKAAPSRAPAQRSAAASRSLGDRPAKPSPQDVFRRAVQKAESVDDQSVAVPRAPVAARADDWSLDDQSEAPAERLEAPAPVPARSDRSLPATRRTTATALPDDYVEDRAAGHEARLAPDYDYEWDADSAPRPAAGAPLGRDHVPDVEPSDRYGSRPQRKLRQLREEADEDVQVLARRARPSALPTILLLVLILVMLAGLGALAWYERAVIKDLLGGFDSHQAAAPVAAPVPDATSKDGDSLLGNGAALPDTAAPSDSGAVPANDVRVVTPGGAPVGNAAPDKPGRITITAGSGDPAAVPSQPSALVAQKATLYEEPADASAQPNSVVAIKAAVTWTATQTSDGPEIVGAVDIPDRGMKIKLTLRRNADKTLPASHVVEVVFSVPTDLPGKGIRDVPRIVLKPAEDGRGQPLVGASAKVADGYFWVALSSVDADIATNLGLLKQREWFDLPILYESGQRAIVTFEKGTTGDRVFDQVLSAWTAGG